MLPRACVVEGCRGLAVPGGSRCEAHRLTDAGTRRQARHSKRRAAARRGGTNAAARMRKAVNSVGYSVCLHCGRTVEARGIEIDHVLPLLDGGLDVESNVQPLCRSCHKDKTSKEAANRRPGGGGRS